MYNASIMKIPVNIAVAIEVINGIYGNNEERIKALEKSGYNAERVQQCVDDLFPIWQKWSDE